MSVVQAQARKRSRDIADLRSASWVVRHLVSKYPNAYNVVSFDKLDYCSSRNNSRMLEGLPNFTFFHGDVTQREDVLRCLKKFKIDMIVHLAAQTHVDLSFGNSLKFSWNNFIGTHQLLECAHHVGTVKRFYHISTDEVRFRSKETKCTHLLIIGRSMVR